MAKRRKGEEGDFPEARFVAPMRKPADVTAERKRLYRATINRRISVEDAAKLCYMLGMIRADLEADMPILDQVSAVPGVDVSIVGVPHDHYLLPDGSYGDADTAKSLWIEHRKAEAEAMLALAPQIRPQLRVIDPDPDIEDSSPAA